MSGAADHVIEPALAREAAARLLDELDVERPEALADLRVAEILRAQRRTMGRMANLRTMMMWLPVVDGDVIAEQPLESARRPDDC